MTPAEFRHGASTPTEHVPAAERASARYGLTVFAAVAVLVAVGLVVPASIAFALAGLIAGVSLSGSV